MSKKFYLQLGVLLLSVFSIYGFSINDDEPGNEKPTLYVNENSFKPENIPVETNYTDMPPFLNNGWSSQTAMTMNRWAHALAFYRSGTYPNDTGFVFIISGGNSSFSIESSMHRYNITTGAWTTMASIPLGRLQVSAITIGSKIYVPGGYSSGFSPTNALHIYDIPTNTWSSGANMPQPTGDAAIGKYNDRYIYVMGGYSGSADLNTVQIYDSQNNTWATGTALNWTAVAGHRASIVGNKIVIACGYSQIVGTTLNQVRVGTINTSDPTQITWVAGPNYPQTAGRLGASPVEINRNNGATLNPQYALFTAGDPNGQGISVLQNTYAYDFTTDTWLDGPNKISGVSNICNLVSFQEGDSVYVMSTGGYNGTSVIGVNERINLGAVPHLPVLNNPSNGATGQAINLALDWNDASHASSYQLQISTNSGFTCIIKDTTLTPSVYNVPGSLLSYNTQYYWRVKAKNIFANSDFSSAFSFTTLAPPAAPSLIFPADGSTGQPLSLNLRWNKTALTNTYHVQLAADSLFTNIIVNDSTLTDSIKAVSGLSNLTKYWWRVRSKNAAGISTFSTQFNFTTIIAAPSAPTLVLPSNGSINVALTPHLDWNDAATATSYQVQIATDAGFANIIKDTSGVLSSQYQVLGGALNVGTQYHWRVSSANEGGSSVFTSAFNFTTVPAPPAAPNLVSPPDAQINVSLTPLMDWDNTPGASSYRIQIATDGAFTNIVKDTSGILTSEYQVLGGTLNANTQYFWRVNAVNPGGTSVYSSTFKFITVPPAPTAPTLVSPSNGAVNIALTPVLDWNDVAGATSYQIQISKTANFSNIIKDTSGVLNSAYQVLLGFLSTNSTYYWRVNATNPGGTSVFSSEFSFTTIPPAPLAPTLLLPVDNGFDIGLSPVFDWSDVADAIEGSGKEGSGVREGSSVTYRLQIATDQTFTSIVKDTAGILSSQFAYSGTLNRGTTYYWRVNATNNGGTGQFTLPFVFKTIPEIPATPSLSLPLNNSTGASLAPLFDWNDVSGAVSYRIQISTDSNFTTTVKDTSGVLTSQYQLPGGLLNYLTKYYWRVNATNTGGTSPYSSKFNFTTIVEPPAQVQFTVIPGGLYNILTGRLNMRDTIKVFLVDSATCSIKDSAKGVVDSVNFGVTMNFSNAPTGKYYIFIYHRNHLATASRFAQTVTRGSIVSYNFTSANSQAFGNNMIQVSSSPVRWAMIPGDGNRDGFVDGLDQTIWIIQNGLDGYLAGDFNGDLFVDGLDQTIWIVQNGQSAVLPCNILDAILNVKGIENYNTNVNPVIRTDQTNEKIRQKR